MKALVLALLSGVVVACGAPMVTLTSSPAVTPFATATSTPSPTTRPVPNGPFPTPTPVPPSPVDDGGTFGPSGLWATRGSHLDLSTDYGTTWVQRILVTGVLQGVAERVLSSVFVLDANHAWSATPGPGSTPYGGQGQPYDRLHVVISRTTDAGRTWRSVTLPGDWGGTQPVLTFADPRHGYLLLAFLRGGGPGAVLADRGWRGDVAAGERTGVDCGSVFGATDAQTVWAGNQGDAGPVSRPILDVSRDGGRTWADARLPGLVGDIYVNDTLVAPPMITGATGAVAVLAETSVDPPAFLIFHTTDGGQRMDPRVEPARERSVLGRPGRHRRNPLGRPRPGGRRSPQHERRRRELAGVAHARLRRGPVGALLGPRPRRSHGPGRRRRRQHDLCYIRDQRRWSDVAVRVVRRPVKDPDVPGRQHTTTEVAQRDAVPPTLSRSRSAT